MNLGGEKTGMSKIKPEWIAEYLLEGLTLDQFIGDTKISVIKSILTTIGDIFVEGYITPSHLADFLNEKMKEEEKK